MSIEVEIEKGYKFVPAGEFDKNHGGMGVYIRHHKYKNQPIRLLEQSPGNIWVSCPDRDLVITLNTNQAQNHGPVESNYDEFVNLSLFNQSAAVDFNLDFFMVNYTQHLGRESTSSHIRRGQPRQKGHSKIISDSGGFQILTERIDYLDPKAIVEWYNTNVDIGLILDIPAITMDSKAWKRLAKVQAANTQIMMDNKVPSLELMNIIHGATERDKEYYRKMVERDDIERLAVGGMYNNNVLNSINSLYNLLGTGQKYKHYHILGVANLLQVTILMRIASKQGMPLITSDSSTHIQEAVAKGYHSHPSISEVIRYINIGDKSNHPNRFSTFSCQCPVCTSIKYVDVLGVVNSNCTAFMLMRHNMFSTQRYMKAMNELAGETTAKEYKEILSKQLKNRRGIEETLKGIDFIDAIEKNGLEPARKQFSYYLGNSFLDANAYSFLESEASGTMFDDGTRMPSVEVPNERLERLISQYEKTPENLKHGSKPKDSKIKGHQIAKSKAKVAPTGKKKIKTKKKEGKKDEPNNKANTKGNAKANT